jgi:hypothetical protein
MHSSQVVRLLNGILKRIDPSIQLSSDTDESQIERNLHGMLATYDKLASYKRAKKHRKDYPLRGSFRLGESKRRGPATDSRTKDFVSALTSAGVPLQRAFNQAVRLNVGG